MADPDMVQAVRAQIADVCQIAELRSQFVEDQLAKGLLETPPSCYAETVGQCVVRARTELLCASVDGRSLGYLLGQTRMVPGTPPSRVSSIEEVYARPEARRLGVAKKLVEGALAAFS